MCTFWKVGTADSSASLRIGVSPKSTWRWTTLPIVKYENANWESSVAVQSWGGLRHTTLVPTRTTIVGATVVASERGRSAITTPNLPRVLSCLIRGDLLRVSLFYSTVGKEARQCTATQQASRNILCRHSHRYHIIFTCFLHHQEVLLLLTFEPFVLGMVFEFLLYRSREMRRHLGHFKPKSLVFCVAILFMMHFCASKSTDSEGQSSLLILPLAIRNTRHHDINAAKAMALEEKDNSE